MAILEMRYVQFHEAGESLSVEWNEHHWFPEGRRRGRGEAPVNRGASGMWGDSPKVRVQRGIATSDVEFYILFGPFLTAGSAGPESTASRVLKRGGLTRNRTGPLLIRSMTALIGLRDGYESG